MPLAGSSRTSWPSAISSRQCRNAGPIPITSGDFEEGEDTPSRQLSANNLAGQSTADLKTDFAISKPIVTNCSSWCPSIFNPAIASQEEESLHRIKSEFVRCWKRLAVSCLSRTALLGKVCLVSVFLAAIRSGGRKP